MPFNHKNRNKILKSLLTLSVIAAFASEIIIAQPTKSTEPFAHTFSIVAMDENTGEMADAFEEYSNLPLAERLIEVLKAAQAAGGDIC